MSIAAGKLQSSQSLQESNAYCERLTRAYAKNFYYGLRLLPQPKRSAMYALYAWMRLVDDIADNEDGRALSQRQEELEAWRTDTHAILRDGASTDTHAVWPAFSDMVNRYAVPLKVFDAVIAGQQQDLSPIEFQTFDDLHQYCYRVAGVVGLASIYVWGFQGGQSTEQLALDKGVAFQLTNILRDLKEDAARGRIYLPREELRAAHVTENHLRQGIADEAFSNLMKSQIARAQDYYQKSFALERLINADSRPTLRAMTDIYHQLLIKVARRPQRVLTQRVSLSTFAKLRIGWRALRGR